MAKYSKVTLRDLYTSAENAEVRENDQKKAERQEFHIVRETAMETPPIRETIRETPPIRETTREIPPVRETVKEIPQQAVVQTDIPLSDNIIPIARPDRRTLPDVPSPSGKRSNVDRRGKSQITQKIPRRAYNTSLPDHLGVRYVCDQPVRVTCKSRGRTYHFTVKSKDISTGGMLLIAEPKYKSILQDAARTSLRFVIKPGVMPEGYEVKVRIQAKMVSAREDSEGNLLCGMEFTKSLTHYVYTKRSRGLRAVSIFNILLMTLLLVTMRMSSSYFYEYNKLIYIYGLMTASYLLTRYIFGALYKPTPIDEEYKPAVSIIIPCYNEEQWIRKTIISCINQNYPVDSLEVIIVDDCSIDNSAAVIENLITELRQTEDKEFKIEERVSFLRQPENLGKREAMARGIAVAKHDLVVFVDSDSFLDPQAIINLVQPFKDSRVGGVSGRTDVANTYTNQITKMQAVRYYISFRIMKAAEGYFNAVGCLSGPLSCYRKDLVVRYMDRWLNQSFLGRKATFGDDRSLTNFILRKNRTCYQDTAICSTIVPNTNKMFLKQQMRWKRSWLRESSIASSFMWKKEPLMVFSFYFGFLIPILTPIIVLYNMVYVPVVHQVVPYVFLIGLIIMAMLMSMSYLLIRRSKLWVYGFFYTLYHIFILIWQMPVAWVTFWKSTWGTRMTTSDLEASKKRA